MISPIGNKRTDLQTALICSTFANIARGLGGGKGKSFTIKDFMLFQYDEDIDLDEETIAMKVAAALGAPPDS